MITLILSLVLSVLTWGNVPAAEITVISAIVESAEVESFEWSEFHADAKREYADEFTALFNSYETKRAKNGRIMIRQGDTGSFKFAKKG